MTKERYTVGRATLWRYIARAAVIARLDKLNAILRAEDKRIEDAKYSAQETTVSLGATDEQRGQALRSSPTKGRRQVEEGGVDSGNAVSVGREERERELIRMKIERLEGVKVIADREHALHCGPGASSSGGAGGGGR